MTTFTHRRYSRHDLIVDGVVIAGKIALFILVAAAIWGHQ